jgi:hypothetical protein
MVSEFTATPVMGQAQAPSQPSSAAQSRGKELAQKYCTTCHLLPQPDALTKKAWVHYLQPEMAKWLGMEPVDYEGLPDGKLLQEAGVFPSSPLMPEEDWFAIWDYYRALAPSQFSPAGSNASPRLGLKQFRVRKVNHHSGVPMTTMVKLDPPRRRLFVGDAYGGSLFILEPSGTVVGRARVGSPPVSVLPRESGFYATLIGRFFPSDTLEGAVAWVPGETGATPVGQPRSVLEQLRRPTDCLAADLNEDGHEDLVVCAFGNRLGHFSWFERRADGQYDEHVLLDRPGAIRSEVRDFNGDGHLDILVLMAQAREGLFLFVNEGKGKFRMETVLETPPSWGLAGFDVADINKDGRMDLVVANGDQGDFALPQKPYHGIRVYFNEGNNRFREAFYYPMAGAYKALARDFDLDGDLDLVAIAYYPDFAASTPQSFVYLENRGDGKFDAFTCEEQNSGRWLVMDAGDLDGDGDEDVVLGSFVRGPTTVPVPSALREAWRTQGAALLFLENVGRQK